MSYDEARIYFDLDGHGPSFGRCFAVGTNDAWLIGADMALFWFATFGASVVRSVASSSGRKK